MYLCMHVHVYTGLRCKIYFLVGVMVKIFESYGLKRARMKCEFGGLHCLYCRLSSEKH